MHQLLSTVLKLLQKSDERRVSVCYCSEMVRKQFGKPLVFYSPNEKKKKRFSKRLCHSCFRKGDARVSKNGQGVFVQTATNATVESVNEGLVVLRARKRNLVIQFKFSMQMVRSHGMQI